MTNSRGFSLLEVLVAFVILAMALGVLLQIFTLATRGHHSAQQLQQAMVLAESKMAELMAAPVLQRGHQQGRLEGDFRWEADTQPYRLPSDFRRADSRVEPMLLEVTISWGKDRHFMLSTLVLGSGA
ncbi:type II secretion system protein [Gallaecimonas kandeliae]|uniref:type IV pilus modification PilV family protein n=1 Tax=Gallaecimonas kandeliae TaxID=3029055 RepID=UPI0026490ED7|nr:type II secretion system protein [Gallaecimonas kandeliae]WKE65669.1 type II secretion system protein [Gallaecimonas kandeliae]